MGVHSFFPENIKQAASERIKFTELAGKVVAVDISIILWDLFQRGQGTKANIDEFHMIPPRPLSVLLAHITEFELKMKRHGMIPFYVMDGLHHINKLASLFRAKNSKAAAEELAILLKESGSSKIEIAKLKKDSVIAFRKDIEAQLVEIFISLDSLFMRSPYEADSQMIDLFKCGIVHAVYSTDSDMAVLGYDVGVLWICERFDFADNREEAVVIDFSKTSTKSLVVTKFLGQDALKDGITIYRKMMHVMACIQGNDYVPEVLGKTSTKKNIIVPAIVELARLSEGRDFEDGVHIYVENVATTQGLKYKETMGFRNQLTTDYEKYFNRGRAMFEHPPVFRFKKKDQRNDTGSLLQLLYGPTRPTSKQDRLRTLTVTLEPLYDLEEDEDWVKTLGFDPKSALAQYCMRDNNELYPYAFAELSRELKSPATAAASSVDPIMQSYPLSEDRLMKPRTLLHMEASFESQLNFDAVAICHIPSDALHKWLACRGIFPNLDCPRIRLEKFVKDVLEQWKSQGNTNCPLVQPACKFTLANYLEMVQLTVGGALEWTNDGEQVLEYLHGRRQDCAKPLASNAIEETAESFISGPSSVHRVERLTEGGNADVTTLQIAFGRRGEASGGKEVVLVRCSVVSSMRTLTQTVLLVFIMKEVDEGKIQPPPISRCTCEAGRFACSHMYCVLYMIAGIQEAFDGWTMAQIAYVLPPPVRLLSGKLLPMQYVYGEL